MKTQQPVSSDADTRALIANFKNFYRNLVAVPLDDISDIYTQNIHFIDPVHAIDGVAELRAYMDALCSNLTSGRFEFLDEVVKSGTAYIKWNMHFVHPKLGGQQITVRGISHIQFTDRIYFHEDVYDLGEMLYLQVPLIGPVNRWLKNRLKGI